MMLLILLYVLTSASSIPVDFDCSALDLAEYSTNNGTTLIALTRAYADTEAGFPLLPKYAAALEIPAGTEAVRITNIKAEWETVSQDISIAPLPAPVPLILTSSFQPSPSSVYLLDEFYPASPVELSGSRNSIGVRQAEYLITPFRYNPVTRVLQKLTSLTFDIETEFSGIQSIEPGKETDFERMLIVTDESLLTTFEELAERRTDQGILTEVISMSTVYSSSSGRDNAEKLRNYVIDYYTSNGLDYLLLGGDTDLVPFRFAFAMDCEAGYHSRENDLPCDLYFSDLDGTWDANGNDIFGEVDDDVDLYPDIYVGRATVENVTETESFINKIAVYEDCIESDTFESVLFLAEVLWQNPYTNSGESKDYIDENFLPDYMNITKLYQADGNENLSTTMTAMNSGQNFINHDGHAWYSTLGVGDDYMSIDDMDAITSTGIFSSVMYSIGCWGAAFDFDAIAEHFLTNPDGCGVGFIGNSSYGWGSPGNPCYGYSDALDHVFFDYLYSDWSGTLGELLGQVKVFFIPYSRWANVYRWHQYDVNLLGDPALRPYRRTPVEIEIDCPELITENTTHFPVYITGYPADGLTVCVRDEGDNWLVTELNATGYSLFEFTSAVTGNVKVTVTGAGVRRTCIEITQATGPDPVLSEIEIDDEAEFGHLSPGASSDLNITILNQGNEGLTNVTLNISDISGPAVLTQSSSSFGDISAGSLATGSPALSLNVNSEAVYGNVVTLSGSIVSNEGTWEVLIPMIVYAPGLYFTTYEVDDSDSGNNDGIPDPGETFSLILDIANFGLLNADTVSTSITDMPDWFTCSTGSYSVPAIPPDMTESFTFECELDAAAPSPSFPWLFLDISSATSEYTTTDSLRLTVGETGISNDVEDGAAGWTHYGANDLWNISTTDSHSPTHSWYCGQSGEYLNNMDCSLLSPEMILAPDATLEFWASFDVTIYGCDGMYVTVFNLSDSEAYVLDYIGSGGALGGGKGIGTGWVPYSYDLSRFEAGTAVKVEFNFVSDAGDVAGGFFIDDITIDGAYIGSTSIEEITPETSFELGCPRPNPATGSFSIPITVNPEVSWSLEIYDISGRLHIQRSGELPPNGLFNINTTELPPGIYFAKLTSGSETASRKVIVID